MEKVAFKMEHISKSFDNGKIKANVDVSLVVYENTVHTILGENGAGKSTLTSILFGLYKPDSGKIFIGEKQVNFKSSKDAVKHKIGMVHQHFKLIENYTVLDNIILGNESRFGFLPLINRKVSEAKIKTIMEKYGIFVDLKQKVSNLTVGQQQRVEILKVLFRDSNILIFDEPTAVLSDLEIQNFLKIIANFKKLGKTIVLISHKLNEIKQVADTATVLRLGKVVGSFDVKTTPVDKIALLMMGKELKQTKNTTDFVAKDEPVLKVQNLNLFLNKSLAYKFLVRCNNIHKAQQIKKNKPLKDLWIISFLNKLTTSNKTPKLVKDLINKLGLSYQENTDETISFAIHKGEIFAIAGVEGNGQSQLVNLICGIEKAASNKLIFNNIDISRWSIRKRINAGISFVLEDRHKYGLILDQTVRFNTVNNQINNRPFSSWNFLKPMEIALYSNTIIKKFDVRGSAEGSAVVRRLSGGNQQKLIIGREMTKQNDLLVLAQVTRGLDIGAIAFIHENILLAKANNKAILLVSYELDEILALADTVAVINKGRIVGMGKRDLMDRQSIGRLIMQ
ncbi:ABC transporter ATP-binding protein [Mycoplasmoides genitalium]